MKLTELPAFKERDIIRCVVESPARSAVKLKYDPELGVFELSRPLVKGLTYPFDWGFVPSTQADDGDPLDVMIFHDAPTTPGLVIPCRVIGVLEVKQREQGGKWERNDRLLAVPVASRRDEEVKDVGDLPKRLREELEEFFVNAAELEAKELRILDWRGPKRGRQLVEDSIQKNGAPADGK